VVPAADVAAVEGLALGWGGAARDFVTIGAPAARLRVIAEEPFGNAATAQFAVDEGTRPRHDVQAGLRGQIQEAAEAALGESRALQVNLPLDRLVMVPGHVGGDGI
jgi:hypothetical protein